MQLQSFVFNAFYENTYLLSAESGETFIIDPGCIEKHEIDQLTEYISEEGLSPIAILNTHCHIDHVLGNAWLKSHYKIPLFIPKGDLDLYRAVASYASNYGFHTYTHVEADGFINEDEPLVLGDERLNVLFAPGHAPGHLMFHHEALGILIAGDVIFKQSIGRTDLPGGDYDTLEKSIKQKVYTLPLETVIYPGHGPSTTVAFERENNPFVKA